MADALVDTDLFIDHLRGARRLPRGRDRLHYSVVTRCELFAGHATEESRIRLLLGPLQELGVTRAVAETAGRLRRTVGLRTPDALIAATALEHGLALLSRNARDFGRVPNLELRRPEPA